MEVTRIPFGKKLIYLLVLSVVLDGLLRRLVGESIGVFVFFAKDVIVGLLGLLVLVRSERAITVGGMNLKLIAGLSLAIMVPCFIYTALIDPALAMFGLKQYALYAWVAPAVLVVFGNLPPFHVHRLMRFIGLLVVGTSVLAVVQLFLPKDHFLNRSVTGASLENFSAGGYLRISSTFPFVAQYTIFLNFAFGAVLYGVANPPVKNRWIDYLSKAWVLVPAYLAGMFATASRGAVFGAGAMFACVIGLLFLRRDHKIALRLLALSLFVVLITMGFQKVLPQVMAGYEARTASGATGDAEHDHTTMLVMRVYDMLTDWNENIEATPLGHGIGIMSNGSDRISRTAKSYRQDEFWTETDLSTTFFEGGWCLIFGWIGFRIWVVWNVVKAVRQIRDSRVFLIAAGLTGFAVIQGIMGTLGIQPPLAIWFWMAVGLVFTLAHHDRALASMMAPGMLVHQPPPRTPFGNPRPQGRRSLPAGRPR